MEDSFIFYSKFIHNSNSIINILLKCWKECKAKIMSGASLFGRRIEWTLAFAKCRFALHARVFFSLFVSFRLLLPFHWYSIVKQCLRPRFSVMQTRLHLLLRRRSSRVRTRSFASCAPKYYAKMTLDECRGLIGGLALATMILRDHDLRLFYSLT